MNRRLVSIAATILTLLTVAAALSLTPGCDLASAANVTQWKNDRADLGIVLSQRGEHCGGQLFMMQDETKFRGREDQVDEFALARRLTQGILSDDGKRMYFPLNKVTNVQILSIEKLVKSNQRYLEVEIDTKGDEIAATWYRGDEVQLEGEFYRYRR
jgi:hypothetical protein